MEQRQEKDKNPTIRTKKIKGLGFYSVDEAIEHFKPIYEEAVKELGYEFIGFVENQFKSSKSPCYIRCPVCAKDPELNGDAIFIAKHIYSIKRGEKCCNCSKRPLYSEEQYGILVRRKIENSNCSVLNIELRTPSYDSVAYLSCKVHGKIEVNLKRILYKDVICKYCTFDKRAEELRGITPGEAVDCVRKDDKYFIKSFMDTGRFHPDTLFERIDSKKWKMKCPVCLWEGTSWVTSLTKGFPPCKCSKAPRYSKEEREKMLLERNARVDYKFDSWAEDYNGINTRLYASCESHGLFKVSIDNYLRGKGCPACRNNEQTEAYINIVLDGELPIALKFGVSTDSSYRVYNQNRRSVYKVINFGVWDFERVEFCQKAEKQVKETLTCGTLSKEEMQDGYSETTFVYNLDKIIKIYEENGGNRREYESITAYEEVRAI